MSVIDSVEIIEQLGPGRRALLAPPENLLGSAVCLSSFGDETLPAPVVPGFPPEGAWVEVSAENGTAAHAGWFSIDARTSTEELADVTVVWIGVDGPQGSILSWTGKAAPQQVIQFGQPFIAPPLWFSGYARSLKERATIAEQLESAQKITEQLREKLERERDDRSRWLDSLVEDACEWADNNSLCSEFENFMDAHNLPGRERDHEVEVTVTASVTVTVSARSADAARETLDTSDVRESISNNLSYIDFDWDLAD